MREPTHGEDEPGQHQHMIRDLHAKHEDILQGFRKVLQENGIQDFDVSKFGLMLRSGPPLCPNGKPSTFRCGLNATGEYECKWVCD